MDYSNFNPTHPVTEILDLDLSAHVGMAKKIEVWRQNGLTGHTEVDAALPVEDEVADEVADDTEESKLVIDDGTVDSSSKEKGKYLENFYEIMRLREQVYSKLNWWPQGLFLPLVLQQKQKKQQQIRPQQRPQQRQQPAKRPALHESTNCMLSLALAGPDFLTDYNSRVHPNQGQGQRTGSGPAIRMPTAAAAAGVQPRANRSQSANTGSSSVPGTRSNHAKELVKRELNYNA